MSIILPASYVNGSPSTPPSWYAPGVTWAIIDPAFNVTKATNLVPNGHNVTLDSGAGELTITFNGWPSTLGYASVFYYPSGNYWQRWGTSYAGLSIQAMATRDEEYNVALTIAGLGTTAQTVDLLPDFAVSEFIINWGDGATSNIAPDSSVFSGDFADNTYTAALAISHTYDGPGSSTGIVITATQGQAYPQDDAAPNIPPRAKFTYAIRDLEVYLDAVESDDIDGTIANYAWDYDVTGNGGTGVESGAPPVYPIYIYDRPNLFINGIRLTVTDDDGATDSYSETFNLYLRGVSAMDGHGRIFATPPEPGRIGVESLRLYYDPATMANYEELPNPGGEVVALWFDRNNTLFYLLGGNLYESSFGGSTVYYWLNYSRDSGQTWQEDVVILDMFEGYSGVHGCALREGGHALIGVDPATNKIKFSANFDGFAGGSNWQEPVEVADYPGSASNQLFIHQQNVGGSAQLVVIHPASGARWISGDFGATWTAAV